jgi:hypothetical protein
MFTPRELALERGWPGRVDGDRVIQLAAQTLQAFFTGGGGAREHAEYPLGDVDFLPPVLYPPNVRVFDGATGEFAFANTAAIYGPEQEIRWPDRARSLESGVAFAAMIGAEGGIGGYTLANTWRAPDLPGAKQRDFALSIGPTLATEVDEWRIAAGGGTLDAGAPEWDALVANAALNTVLRAGDLLVLDLGGGGPVERGATVELEHAEIGVLRNRVAA